MIADQENKPTKKKRRIDFFFNRDNLFLGIVLGVFAPLISFFIYRYVGKYKVLTWHELWQWAELNQLYTVWLSLSLMANAVLFALYINSHIDKTARGIFAVTCLYGLIILLIKVFS